MKTTRHKKTAYKAFLIILTLAPIRAFGQQNLFKVYDIPGNFGSSFEDMRSNSGQVFIGSEKGLLVFENEQWNLIGAGEGLEDSHVHALSANQDGVLLSTSSQGLYSYSDKKLKKIPTPTVASFEAITSILVRPGIDSVMGTDNGKIMYKTVNGSFNTWKDLQASTAFGRVNNIHHEKIGTNPDFLVSATSNGNVLWVPGANQIAVFNTSNSPVPSNTVLTSGNFKNFSYYGTDNGLYITDLTGFPAQQIKTEVLNSANSELPSNRINALSIQDANTIWVGTDEGLVRIENNSYQVYNTQNSNLPSNNIIKITRQQDTILWLLTANGELCKLTKGTLSNSSGSIETSNRQIEIYPNPSEGEVSLNFKYAAKEVNVRIISSTGKTVGVYTFHNKRQVSIAPSLQAGVYFVEIYDREKGLNIQKLVRE